MYARRSTIISSGDFGSGSIIGRRGEVFMIRKRGNPNWERLFPRPTTLCTEFEMQVRHLHLAPEQYVVSAELRKWCEAHKNQYYIPEWLLKAWDIPVNPYFKGAA
jgi:hypothetical protein